MLRELYYQFLPYRSYFIPFLVWSAIAAACWFVYRLYRVRSHRQRLSFYRETVLLTFVVYLAGVAVATLTPNRSDRLRAVGRGGIEVQPNLASLTCSSANLPAGSRAQAFCVHYRRANVALFFPLGILIPLVWRRLRFGKGLLIAIVFSVSIEVVQYVSSAWGSYRAADVNDVILNVLGASLGLALVFILRSLRGTRPAVARA